MLNICFFKCGNCENATDVGTQSGIGHLNGFSPGIVLYHHLFSLVEFFFFLKIPVCFLMCNFNTEECAKAAKQT